MKGTIKSKESISWLFEHGIKHAGKGFMAFYCVRNCEREGVAEGRIAVAAGKRLGSAPVRNRAKRRLREAARSAGAPWNGFDVVLVAKKDFDSTDFETLKAHMNKLEAKLNYYTAHKYDEGGRELQQQLPVKVEQTGSCGIHNAAEVKKDTSILSDYNSHKSNKTAFIIGIPKNIALLCISVYRHAISPLFPPSCRFVPTCSEYARISFQRFGFWKGLWLTVTRIGRCHPFSKGGYDPVPEKIVQS